MAEKPRSVKLPSLTVEEARALYAELQDLATDRELSRAAEWALDKLMAALELGIQP